MSKRNQALRTIPLEKPEKPHIQIAHWTKLIGTKFNHQLNEAMVKLTALDHCTDKWLGDLLGVMYCWGPSQTG